MRGRSARARKTPRGKATSDRDANRAQWNVDPGLLEYCSERQLLKPVLRRYRVAQRSVKRRTRAARLLGLGVDPMSSGVHP